MLDGRLKLLQAQIEPRFLFNRLANVQELVESGSPRTAPLLRSLIEYLRAAVPELHDGPSALGDEVAHVRAYLDPMLMRMPDRLHCEIHLPNELGALRFPPMALPTLVENAIRHGIDPSEAGGRFTVRALREGDEVRLIVCDIGVGLRDNASQGTALANLRERPQGLAGSRRRARWRAAARC